MKKTAYKKFDELMKSGRLQKVIKLAIGKNKNAKLQFFFHFWKNYDPRFCKPRNKKVVAKRE